MHIKSLGCVVILLAATLAGCSRGSVDVKQPGVDSTAEPRSAATAQAGVGPEAATIGAATPEAGSAAQPAPQATTDATAQPVPNAARLDPFASTTPLTITTVAELTANSDRYVDKIVTVDGRVSAVHDPTALVLGAETQAGGGGVLIVSGLQQVQASVGARARVTGTVRKFDAKAVGTEVGRGLDGSFYGGYAGKTAIVASTVVVMP